LAATNSQGILRGVFIDSGFSGSYNARSKQQQPPFLSSNNERTGLGKQRCRCGLKGEGLTNVRAWRFLAAVVFTLISSGGISAQSRAAQISAKEPAREQSTNQIVGAPQQTLPKVEVFPVPLNTVAPKEVHNEIDLEDAVIPPAPMIVKRSTNAITIPVDGQTATAKSDSKYEERPAISSSVSVGSVFGYRRDPFTRREKFHSGVDIKARWGDPVGASQAGIIQFAGWYHGYGNLIIVAHGGGVTTHYAHLSSFYVEVGTRVERGTIIGRAGSTGRATSPHLHYELRFDGNPLNPFQPLALDPTSDYFRQSRPTVDAGRGESTSLVVPLRDK
jgi:murein DD-endopeptidase MepM/ murein hydrolase activator NlpD